MHWVAVPRALRARRANSLEGVGDPRAVNVFHASRLAIMAAARTQAGAGAVRGTMTFVDVPGVAGSTEAGHTTLSIDLTGLPATASWHVHVGPVGCGAGT